MRTLFNVVFLSLYLIWGLSDARAEENEAMDTQFEEIQEKLELTDAQMEEMRPIVEAGQQKQRDILASYGIDPDGGDGEKIGRRQAMSIRREIRAAREEMFDQLKPILTEAQLEEFTEMQEEQAEKRRLAIRERLRG
ncbi:MAG: hypothetical protein AAFV47_05675 [Pseudomonadota bacterium]